MTEEGNLIPRTLLEAAPPQLESMRAMGPRRKTIFLVAGRSRVGPSSGPRRPPEINLGRLSSLHSSRLQHSLPARDLVPTLDELDLEVLRGGVYADDAAGSRHDGVMGGSGYHW